MNERSPDNMGGAESEDILITKNYTEHSIRNWKKLSKSHTCISVHYLNVSSKISRVLNLLHVYKFYKTIFHTEFVAVS